MSNPPPVLITTTSDFEGHRIIDYHGIYSGNAIQAANFIADGFAKLKNFLGGRSGSYESEMEEAQLIAMRNLREQAVKAGGNALVGVTIDYEFINMQKGGMLMAVATGTAVTIEPIQ